MQKTWNQYSVIGSTNILYPKKWAIPTTIQLNFHILMLYWCNDQEKCIREIKCQATIILEHKKLLYSMTETLQLFKQHWLSKFAVANYFQWKVWHYKNWVINVLNYSCWLASIADMIRNIPRNKIATSTVD